MKYIETLRDGMHVSGVYLCKTKTIALTKNGKEYGSITLQDKTGQLDGKIWDINSPAIGDFEPMEYIHVDGNVTVFNNANQLNITRIRRAEEGEYSTSDYFPVSSKDTDKMYGELKAYIASFKNKYLKELMTAIFINDKECAKSFCEHSAAKTVHHGFIGGLLEHSLSVTKICDDMAEHYPFLNRDLLLSGAMTHDIGKTKELSSFPMNDYTDDGQLLGHIIMGVQMIDEKIKEIPDFPHKLRSELLHLVLSHHGELEFGSPKKPALMEALVLSSADNLDAKLETMYEALESKAPQNDSGWVGYNKLLESNIRKTSTED